MTEPRTDAALEGATRKPGWRPASLWYLAYLGVLVFPLVFDPTVDVWDWVATGVVVALFVPLYLSGERGSEAVRRRMAMAVTGLGLVAVFVNSGAAVLFIYAAAWAGTFQPRRLAWRWLIALTGLLLVLSVATPVPLPYRLFAFLPPVLFVWIVGVATMEDAERDRDARRLRVDNARIEHLATATERERIARDLHDLLGHTLTSVVVRAQLVQRLATGDPTRAAAEAAEIERAARDALAQVRGTVSGWRRANLDDEIDAARTALAAVDVTLLVERDPGLRLAPSVESALALALREAVTNVVRHAAARRCTVTIGRADGEVALRVSDDGRGATGPEGGGLTGMRERITALGGHVERAVAGGSQGGSGPPLGPGTTLTVSVPAEVAG